MVRRALVFATVLSCILSSVSAMADNGKLVIVEKGRANCTIVIPKDAGKWTVTAADWLKEYVGKVSGAELPIVTDDKIPVGNLISVGETSLAKKAGVHTRDLKWDGCKTVVKGKVLYLLGHDQEKEIKDHPTVGSKGTCRAVLLFLEDHCGVRWLLPTPKGEYIPRRKDISVPSNLAKSFIPAFAYSNGRATYNKEFLGDGGGTPASIINNFRDGLIVWPGGHTYYNMVPSSAYFAEHPEYFALINGKRTGEGNHLCSTNPDVKKILTTCVQERFDAGYDWVSIGQEDGYMRCECPECEKLDNYRWSPRSGGWDDFMYGALQKTPCERLFLLHKAVIDEVAKTHPDKKVLLMCYAPTAWPSEKIDYFGDNVILELMNQDPEFLQAWKGKGTGIVGYVYWFNIVCPLGFDIHATPKEVSQHIRYLHDAGFVGLYQFAETGWGFQGPSFYVLGRMMGDPKLDYRAIVSEYCRGTYGKAANTMLHFFDTLYTRHEAVLPPLDQRTAKIPRDLDTTELFIRLYPPEHLAQLEELLKQAEAEADTEQAKGWVRLSRDQLDFTTLITDAVSAYRRYKASSSLDDWRKLKAAVEAFEAYRTKIINYPKEYSDNWWPGYDHFCNYLTANVQHESKVYYTPWEKRKPEVLQTGTKGMGIGYGGSFGYNFVKEPLTLDFSIEPETEVPAPPAERTTVISFERLEGFPGPGASFTGLTAPAGKAVDWTNESTAANQWLIEDGPQGAAFPDAPEPISGRQMAVFGSGGSGVNVGSVKLDPNARLSLFSFRWAYRGNGDSRIGGNAWLEVEYFGIDGQSLGTQKFQGGLSEDWQPKFDVATASRQFRNVPLSRIVFRGTPPDPATGHGTFFLEDLMLVKEE